MSKSYENYQKYIDEIAEIFYKAIESNNVSWTKTWTAREIQLNSPHNPITKTVYKGLNSLYLDITKEDKNYKTNSWLTFNQIKELGGHIEKGTKSVPIAFYSRTKKVKEKINGQTIEVIKELEKPIFMKSAVFNLDQTKGIDKSKIDELLNSKYETLEEFNNIEKAEDILNNIDLEIIHQEGSDSPYYSPLEDTIYLPSKIQFKSEEAYYSTALHEIGHSTGHEKRLNRPLLGMNEDKISYAKEELRAEIYSYLQAKELGIGLDLQNHQSYVKSWASILKDDKKEIILAVKDAMKIVKYVKDNYVSKDTERELNVKKENPKANILINNENVKLSSKLPPLIEYENYIKNMSKDMTNKEILESSSDESLIYFSHFPNANYNDFQKATETILNKIQNEKINSLIKEDYNEIKNITKDIATELYKKSDVSIKDTKSKVIYFKVENKIISVREENSIYQISNKDKYVSNLFDTNNDMFKGNAEILKDKRINKPKKEKAIFNEYPKIPMNQLLEQLGFEIKRDKTSRNSMVMTDGKDTLVINIGKGILDKESGKIKGEGNYVYYNTDKTLNDRGTIFNFCKNRNINVNDLVAGTNINMDSHFIIKGNKSSYNPKINEEFNDLKSYNDVKLNTLSTIRKISKDTLGNYPSIKVDKFQNIIFPSYTIEDDLLKLSGMNKKLLSRPLTHDKEGIKYEKPITSLEYGKSGLSILRTSFCESAKVKTIIVGENSIDNLSYVELNNVDLNTSLLVSFNGSMKEEGIKAFQHLVTKIATNTKEIVKAFDNDKQGTDYDKTLNKVLTDVRKDIKQRIHKSDSNDWNDDLKNKKKSLYKNINLNKQSQEKGRV